MLVIIFNVINASDYFQCNYDSPLIDLVMQIMLSSSNVNKVPSHCYFSVLHHVSILS